MAPAPSEQEIIAIAERALAHAGAPAQVVVSWELALRSGLEEQAAAGFRVEYTCLRTGVGRAEAGGIDDERLAHAARQAERFAERGSEPRLAELPEPVPGRAHQGWDPAVLSLAPPRFDAEIRDRAGGHEHYWSAGATRTAVVSTTGTRSFEQRSFIRLEIADRRGGRTVRDTSAATGPRGLDVEGAVRRVTDGVHDGQPDAAPAGEWPVVLGPDAMAVVLELLAPHFGILAAAGGSAVAARLGHRIAASCISLSDSPRFPGTLPRSFDAEGVPRQPVPLVQDGVAHRVVRDTASPGGPSTGHATVALQPAPAALNLVLVGGGAGGEQELMAPIQRGLLIPSLSADGSRAFGVHSIDGGVRAAPLRDAEVVVDPLEVLAGAQALSMTQKLVTGQAPDARGMAATVCPAVRTRAGISVRG